MAEMKTKPHDGDVLEFLRSVENETRRADCLALLPIFESITRCKATMWGPAIVGFGSYHYRYDTGREGDMLMTGFSPRKANLTLYIMPGFEGYGELMAKLGKHKHGKCCLYINKLSDVHLPTLKQLIRRSFAHVKKKFPTTT